MRIIETVEEIKEIKKGCVLTIGNFDGVHLGHREILSTAGQTAKQKRIESVVMTFEPHPAAVLHPELSPGVLTPLELKKHLLGEFGMDYLLVLKSTVELLALSPADFLEQFLVKNIQPSVVVEGRNFNFGSGRAGNINTLQQLGTEKGFKVSVIEAKEIKLSIGQAVKVSSTLIRNALQQGRVDDAAVALGRAYRLIGRVVPGAGKGRQLGFPTTNLEPGRQIIPAEGVYAGFVEIGDNEEQVCKTYNKFPAAFSIGWSETFGSNNPLTIEAHILIQNIGQLAGKWMTMDFIRRIRSQQKFRTESQLSAQIAKDCEKAKNILRLI